MEAICCYPEGLYRMSDTETRASETRYSIHKDPNPNPLKKITKRINLNFLLLKILVCYTRMRLSRTYLGKNIKNIETKDTPSRV